MNRIIIKNTITGEEKVLLNQGSFSAPWKVDRIEHMRKPGEPGEPVVQEMLDRRARLAVWAEKHGMPLVEFLQFARWLIKKDCPFCQVVTKVLEAIDELGEHAAEKALTRILDAKSRNDHAELEKIRKELWPSEQPTSRT